MPKHLKEIDVLNQHQTTPFDQALKKIGEPTTNKATVDHATKHKERSNWRPMTNNYGRTHDQTFGNSRTYDQAQPPNYKHTTKHKEIVDLTTNNVHFFVTGY